MVGVFGGRFDYEVVNINVLWMFVNLMRIVFLSEESSLLLLLIGYVYEIYVDKLFEGFYCGFVSIGVFFFFIIIIGLYWNLGIYFF